MLCAKDRFLDVPCLIEVLIAANSVTISKTLACSAPEHRGYRLTVDFILGNTKQSQLFVSSQDMLQAVNLSLAFCS